MKDKEKAELAAIKRVLKLAEIYIKTQDQNLLLAANGGTITWGELNNHIKSASKLSVLKI